jgi:hypothetical protein
MVSPALQYLAANTKMTMEYENGIWLFGLKAIAEYGLIGCQRSVNRNGSWVLI